MKSKGNILIIVLFILIASSLFAVLLGQQARSLLQSIGLVHDYYQAYYHAYAGIELGFTQQLRHGFGFESEEYILFPPARKHGSGDSFTSLSLNSRSDQLQKNFQGSGCSDSYNFITLAGGESFVIPLFYDTAQGFDDPVYITISSSEFLSQYDVQAYVYSDNANQLVIKVIDEQLKNYNKQGSVDITSTVQMIGLSQLPFLQYDSSDTTNKNYLIFANPGETTENIGICLLAKKKLVTPFVYMKSTGGYRDTQVTLYAKKQFQIPGFLTYGTIQ